MEQENTSRRANLTIVEVAKRDAGICCLRLKAEQRGRDMAAFTRMVRRIQSLLASHRDAR